MNWKTWLNGVIGAFVNGGWTAVGGETIGLSHKQALSLAAWSGFVGIWLYLKQHPTPWDGTDRRGAANPPA